MPSPIGPRPCPSHGERDSRRAGPGRPGSKNRGLGRGLPRRAPPGQRSNKPAGGGGGGGGGGAGPPDPHQTFAMSGKGGAAVLLQRGTPPAATASIGPPPENRALVCKTGCLWRKNTGRPKGRPVFAGGGTSLPRPAGQPHEDRSPHSLDPGYSSAASGPGQARSRWPLGIGTGRAKALHTAIVDGFAGGPRRGDPEPAPETAARTRPGTGKNHRQASYAQLDRVLNRKALSLEALGGRMIGPADEPGWSRAKD